MSPSLPPPPPPWPVDDVLVIGGGIAAFCAAIAAREAGAGVRLVDAAPAYLRGGNARHSRNLRLAHAEPSRLFPCRYPSDEFEHELCAANDGQGDAALARRLAEGSAGLPGWLAAQGVQFEEPARGTLPWSRRTAFFLGGGKAAINALAARAERLGVTIHQDTEALPIELDGPSPRRIPLHHAGRTLEARARAVCLCCGGYQANPGWLAETWGEAAADLVVRGTPFADGEILRALLAQGAAPAGEPGACHLVAVDARSPVADGGIVTRVDGMPWGLVVDRTARRFHDEGAEISPRRYSAWGRLVARRPEHRAFLILDAEGRAHTTPSIYPPIEADTIAGLAAALGLDPAVLTATFTDFNRAVQRAGTGAECTEGLTPPKSRLARPLTKPPFAAYPMAPGITGTSHGLRVDPRARVLRNDGRACPDLFAAGAIMAPAILGTGYLAGTGLTIGAVFGRIAGAEAAHYVRTGR
ncbi:FAD-dependent tricarballylate dehydrogenase TcuA [Thioflavicoccus mobilis]|nr:FAD-dependent tricarballylate dehydrogenase TcuA [Thioflavicoccus mobilis]